MSYIEQNKACELRREWGDDDVRSNLKIHKHIRSDAHLAVDRREKRKEIDEVVHLKMWMQICVVVGEGNVTELDVIEYQSKVEEHWQNSGRWWWWYFGLCFLHKRWKSLRDFKNSKGRFDCKYEWYVSL